MSNLTLRILFGALYVVLMVGATMLGHPFFGILMALLVFLSINELATLAGKTSAQHRWINPAAFAGLVVYVTFIGARDLTWQSYLFMFAIQAVCLYLTYTPLRNKSILNYVSSTVYLALPLLALAIWFMQNKAHNVEYILFFLVTIWMYDSMAYVVGKAIGKRPIFPKVSPKKTIEGTLGGVVVTVFIMSVLYVNLFHLPVKGYLLAPVIIVFAIFGDFVESYMKRKIGVKDSGKIMPGHGGVLDRLDSIYPSALPYLVIMLLV